MAQLYSIEGNIGSGKSTLINALKHDNKIRGNSNIIFMEEPVSQWVNIKDNDGVNMIEKFYIDQNKYAFSFQMMAYITRLSMLKKCIRENPDAIIICERSLDTDKNIFAKMLYDEGKIESVNYQIYTNWFDEFVSDIPECGIIYVRTHPTTSYERVKKRDRKGETMPLSYLENCHKYHEKWVESDKNFKLLLDGEKHREHMDDYNDWIEDIYKIIYGSNSASVSSNSASFDTQTIQDLATIGC